MTILLTCSFGSVLFDPLLRSVSLQSATESTTGPGGPGSGKRRRKRRRNRRKGDGVPHASHDLHVTSRGGALRVHHMWGQHADRLIAYRAHLPPKNFWSFARGIGSRRQAAATRLGFGAATTRRRRKGVPTWTGKHTSLTGLPRSPRKRRHNIKGAKTQKPSLSPTPASSRNKRRAPTMYEFFVGSYLETSTLTRHPPDQRETPPCSPR
jgi:hypothetical protein